MDGEPSGVVRAGQVVARVGLLLLRADHSAELLDGQHLALVGDRVHGVLVRVRGLEQPALKERIFYYISNFSDLNILPS